MHKIKYFFTGCIFCQQRIRG